MYAVPTVQALRTPAPVTSLPDFALPRLALPSLALPPAVRATPTPQRTHNVFPPLKRAHRPVAPKQRQHLVRLPVVKNAYSVVPPAAKKQPAAPTPPIVSDTIGAPVAIGGPLDANAV